MAFNYCHAFRDVVMFFYVEGLFNGPSGQTMNHKSMVKHGGPDHTFTIN